MEKIVEVESEELKAALMKSNSQCEELKTQIVRLKKLCEEGVSELQAKEDENDKLKAQVIKLLG